MARYRANKPHRLWSGRSLGLAVAVLLCAVAAAPAQETPRNRAQDVLKSALDTYKRGDYEGAAALFTQAQQWREDLSPSDRLDLETFSQQNKTALRARHDGTAALRQAESALNQGRTTEAAKYVKAAMVNQYLSPGDRQTLENLKVRMQPAGPAPQGYGAIKGNAKSLLTGARAAYQAGELDVAESLANDAERAGAAASWLQPWADTPAKIRRDVAVARSRQGPMVVRGPVEMLETAPPAVGTPAPKLPMPGITSVPGKQLAAQAPVAQGSTFPPVTALPQSPSATAPLQGPSLTPGGGAAPPPVTVPPVAVLPPAPKETIKLPTMPPALPGTPDPKDVASVAPNAPVEPKIITPPTQGPEKLVFDPPSMPSVPSVPSVPSAIKEPTRIAQAPTVPTPIEPKPLVSTPSVLTPPPVIPSVQPSPIAPPSPVVQVGAQVLAPGDPPVVAQVPSLQDVPPPPAESKLIPPLSTPKAITPPANTPAPAPDPKVAARKLLDDGYKALAAGDLETARLMAFRVRDMRVMLDANERGPEHLLQDVQQRAAAISRSNAPKEVLDPRALIREGKALLREHRLDEAERKCNLAASVKNAHWGLFEYSPDQFRVELQRARAVHNREESVKLLADARKLYTQGNYDQAKKKAWRAQELHGPYSPWDFGDRPQRLLAEIGKAETAKGGAPRAPVNVARTTQPADNGGPANLAKTSAPIVPSARAKALALVAEARELERRGQLAEANQKVQEARKLGVIFAPGEDSPEAVMLSLAGRCRNQIQQTLQQVTQTVSEKPGDVARLQQAQQQLAGARLLAMQFGLDSTAIDQKAAWVQQAALQTGTGAIASTPPVKQMQHQTLAAGVSAAKHREGLDKLERARLELRHGSYTIARRLAEDAFDASYGVQKEAELVLRDIDAEEHNQRLLVAQRTFDAGVDAYLHGEFRQASSILANVDYALLSPQHQQRLREIMSTREVQALPAPPAGQKVLLTQGTAPQAPGTAVATDKGAEPLDSVKAMEQVQYQQMAARNAQAQKSAMELFRSGQKMKAVEMLSEQLAQIEQLQFSPEVNRNLRTPLERRMSEFRTMMAQQLLDDQRKGTVTGKWDENKYQDNVRKRQDEVADLMKQCQALNREGKYKESLALAYKAKELDPDNVAAGISIQMTNILIAQQHGDRTKQQVEDTFFWELTEVGPGPRPTEDQPFAMSPSALKRHELRSKNVPNSIIDSIKNPKERAIQYRLEQPITFGFRDTPLKDVIESLSKLSNFPIYEDSQALQQASIGLESPLTMECNGLAMKSALNILLKKMQLTYVIKDESLMITTIDKARSNFKRAVYPVGDLIIPVDDHPLPDVFNLERALAQQVQAVQPMQNYVVGMMQPGLASQSMGLAPPVSSLSGGLGGAFAATSSSQPQSPGSPPAPWRAQGAKLHDLLMELIKGTIAPHSWKEMGGPGTIQYYPLGMALVINQAQEVQEDVENLLKALRRLQDMEVAIEMRLVLVSESFYERIGVDFNVNLKTNANSATQNEILNSSFTPFGTINKQFAFNNTVTGLTPAGTLTPDLGIPIKNSSFNFSVPPFGGYSAPGLDGGISLGLAFLSEIQVYMILEAAQADSRTNIMMAPKITVFNGQAAFISVLVHQYINTGISAVPIMNGVGLNTAQIVFQPNNRPFPIGTTMTVIPVVSADRRFVRINLSPNITNFVDGNVIPLFQVQVPTPNLVEGPLGIGIPTGQPTLFNTFQIQQPRFSNISLNTTVNVPDGGTVLLGGIKVMSEGRNEAGPPILSKIPYLDRLFRNVGFGRDAQSLMIMVTPRIIINEEEEAIFTGQIAPIPRP